LGKKGCSWFEEEGEKEDRVWGGGRIMVGRDGGVEFDVEIEREGDVGIGVGIVKMGGGWLTWRLGRR
jgi:hypothetical protein